MSILLGILVALIVIKMKRLLILPLILALCSCATIQTYLGSAQEVQQEVALLAALTKPYVPVSDVPLVHSFAVGLAQNTNPSPPPPPVTGHPKTDALIKAAIAFVDLAIAKYGGTTGLDYQHAVGNGLLTSF